MSSSAHAVPSPPPHPAATPRVPGQARRRQLLNVAIDLFGRNGFSGTKTKDIAAAAGVSEAILFRHFATKEDLYHAILDAQANQSTFQWLGELRGFAERSDDEGFFRCFVSNILKSFQKEPAFHRLMLYASLEGHTFAGLFHERVGLPMFDFVRNYIARRQQDGAFRRSDLGAAAIFVFSVPVHYAIGRYLFRVKKLPLAGDEVVDQFASLILSGLQKPARKK